MKRQIITTAFILIFTLKVAQQQEMGAKQQEEKADWDILIQAIIQVESQGDPFAVGSKNDVGILQITPIYVKEVNRILNRNEYSLTERTDVQKSLEMFEIYQSHHNPDKDLLKAIKLHNPRAGKWYSEKVMKMFNELKS